MTETAKPTDAAQNMLNAAMDAEASRQRLMKKQFDVADEAPNVASRGAKGGGKLSRSETVTVRLDPKLRYLAELAARLHRRTLSSYIEWAIKASIDSEPLRPAGYTAEQADGITIGSEAELLWDVDEADRFAKLALRYPHLLSHEEQVRWKLIRECGYLWRGKYSPPPLQEWRWQVVEDSFCFDRLRDKWELFCAVANGDKPASELPTWAKTNLSRPPGSPPGVKPAARTGFDDMDDDIPF